MFGLSSLAVRLIAGAVIVLIILGLGMRAMFLIDAQTIDKLHAQQAAQQAAGRQVQAVQKTLTVADTHSETVAQAGLSQQAKVIIERIPTYVSNKPSAPIGCVTWGMLRLHDAAVAGVEPSSLEPPAGQLDGSCSLVAPSVFMGVVAGNYAVAKSNAEQLDALEADIAARGQAITNPGVVAP